MEKTYSNNVEAVFLFPSKKRINEIEINMKPIIPIALYILRSFLESFCKCCMNYHPFGYNKALESNESNSSQGNFFKTVSISFFLVV